MKTYFTNKSLLLSTRFASTESVDQTISKKIWIVFENTMTPLLLYLFPNKASDRPIPTTPVLSIKPFIIDKLNCNCVHCVLHKLDTSIISVSYSQELIDQRTRKKFKRIVIEIVINVFNILRLLGIFYGPLRIGCQYWWMYIRFENSKTWKFNRKNNDMEIYTLIIFKYLDISLRFDTSLSKCVDAS